MSEVDSMNRLRVQAENKAALYRRALELACNGDGDEVARFVSEASTAIDEERAADGVAPTEAQSLPARVLAMCKARGWSLHWTHRGAYLHLESSELIEALRGKRGDPLGEAADVLLVLMSITESNGIAWPDVLAQCVRTVEKLEAAPRYKGEEFTDGVGGTDGR